MSLLKLIRFPNLLIVALTQFFLYYQIILPALAVENIISALSQEQFLLYVLITVLVTAGGYIINDIIDLKIDLINKPEKVIVSRKLARSTAYWLYFCLNLGAFILSLSLAFLANRMSLLFLCPVAIFGLLAYSFWLKKRPLSGNILISIYCAGVAAVVWLAEQPALAKLPKGSANDVTELLLYYAIFAFLSTLFREIVKDLEDAAGDTLAGARTMPIAWGESVSKRFALGTSLFFYFF